MVSGSVVRHLALRITLAWVVYSPTVALSASICRAVALRDVAATESPESIIRRGDYDDGISQYNVDKQTGRTSFCSHGGYCYPTHVYVEGQKHEALRLTNCRVGAKAFEDQERVSYALDVDRTRNSAITLRIYDVENRLSELGLCSACAGNVAAFFVRRPNSTCGRLAQQALEGNPVAAGKLRDGSECDQFPWPTPNAQAGPRR